MLGSLEIIAIILRQERNNWVQLKKRCLENKLFAILRYYDAIMTLITIIAIIALFSVVEASMK